MRFVVSTSVQVGAKKVEPPTLIVKSLEPPILPAENTCQISEDCIIVKAKEEREIIRSKSTIESQPVRIVGSCWGGILGKKRPSRNPSVKIEEQHHCVKEGSSLASHCKPIDINVTVRARTGAGMKTSTSCSTKTIKNECPTIVTVKHPLPGPKPTPSICHPPCPPTRPPTRPPTCSSSSSSTSARTSNCKAPSLPPKPPSCKSKSCCSLPPKPASCSTKSSCSIPEVLPVRRPPIHLLDITQQRQADAFFVACEYKRSLSRLPASMSTLVKHNKRFVPLPNPPPHVAPYYVCAGINERDLIFEELCRNLADAEFEYEKCICLPVKPPGCRPKVPPENARLQRLWFHTKDLEDYICALERYMDELEECLKFHIAERMRKRELVEDEERRLRYELEVVKTRALFLCNDK